MKEYIFPDKNIYYRRNTFSQGRPTLVFVHGLSGSSSAWLPYEQQFENTYNILTLDLRGHGKSKKYPNYKDYTIERFANDIYDLITHLKLNQFILISHSFGSLVALEFLARHQNCVKAAILLSPSLSFKNRLLAKATQPLLSMASAVAGVMPFSHKPGGHIDYTHYQGTGDWNVRRTFADVRNTSLRVYLYATKQSYAFDRDNFLEKISIPVLLAHGKNDTIFPVNNSLQMAKKIKHSRLVLLDNTDHILVLNNVREVTNAIEQFIAGVR